MSKIHDIMANLFYVVGSIHYLIEIAKNSV